MYSLVFGIAKQGTLSLVRITDEARACSVLQAVREWVRRDGLRSVFFFIFGGEEGGVAHFFCGMDSCRFHIIFFSSSKTPNVFGRKVGVSAISLPPTLCSSPSASASYERTNERTDFVRSNALTMFFELDVCWSNHLCLRTCGEAARLAIGEAHCLCSVPFSHDNCSFLVFVIFLCVGRGSMQVFWTNTRPQWARIATSSSWIAAICPHGQGFLLP